MTIEEVAEISGMSFFMLTGGVGIKVENSMPRVIPHKTRNEIVVSISILDTLEGFVPHTLMIPKDADLDIVQVLFDALSKQSPNVKRDYTQSIGTIVDQDMEDSWLYRLKVPRVIPAD
jgi:hypothetical protein